MNITEEEHREIIRKGSKKEQRDVLASMVKDYLENKGGVITRREPGDVKTYWEHDPDTSKLKKIL